MKRIVSVNLLVLVLSVAALAQNQAAAQSSQSSQSNEACHVYVVDVERARQAFEKFEESGKAQPDAKALSGIETLFPEFRPSMGEEVLTTKTYPFPNSKLVITASVYYTDESMLSSQSADSMLIGVVVAPKAQENAIHADDNVVAEVTLDNGTDAVRAKKYVKVGGRLHLLGIECRSKPKYTPKP
ncbi:MAG TPA: hypothetical protein VGB73_03600 [Pyrinomonadaceae bacterium]|jgi:hypothetical protein